MKKASINCMIVGILFVIISACGLMKVKNIYEYESNKPIEKYEPKGEYYSFREGTKIDLEAKDDGYYYSLVKSTGYGEEIFALKQKGSFPEVEYFFAPEGASAHAYYVSKEIVTEDLSSMISDDLKASYPETFNARDDMSFRVIDMDNDIFEPENKAKAEEGIKNAVKWFFLTVFSFIGIGVGMILLITALILFIVYKSKAKKEKQNQG